MHRVIRYVGEDVSGIVFEIADYVSQHNGNIVQSFGRVFGGWAFVGVLFTISADPDTLGLYEEEFGVLRTRIWARSTRHGKQAGYIVDRVVEPDHYAAKERERYLILSVETSDMHALLSRLTHPADEARISIQFHDGVMYPKGKTPFGEIKPLEVPKFFARFGLTDASEDVRADWSGFEQALEKLKEDGVLERHTLSAGSYLPRIPPDPDEE